MEDQDLCSKMYFEMVKREISARTEGGEKFEECLAHFARAAADCILMMDFAATKLAEAKVEQIKKDFTNKLKEQAR
jgi:hypothetical protein